jgi:glutamate-ammonia-ligase adenylyltransferase
MAAAQEALAAHVERGEPKRSPTRCASLRRRVFVHAMARDLTGRAGLAEVCADMTRWPSWRSPRPSRSITSLGRRFGEPRDEAGAAQKLVIVGMGKLGGGELNVSSDIDCRLRLPEDGETDGRRTLGNREFSSGSAGVSSAPCTRSRRRASSFRVDTRLRPYGESGPLAVPYSALEQYLVTQGRAWERYAWLKARALTGERHDELYSLVTPFVFRNTWTTTLMTGSGTSIARSRTRASATTTRRT